jgi:hypothetical protein
MGGYRDRAQEGANRAREDIQNGTHWTQEVGSSIGKSLLDTMKNFLPDEIGSKFGNIFETAGGNLGDIFGSAFMADFQKKTIDTFKGLAEDVSKEWAKIDQAAFNLSKQIGLSATAANELRKQFLDLSTIPMEGVTGLSAKLNMSAEEMIQLHGKFNTAVERSIQMTNDQIVALSSMSRVVGEDVAVKLTASLDNFGLSATDAGEMLTNMYNTSMKKGISLEKYAKNVADHIGLAQKYTFKNGINGLTAMAEKAAKMRVDMDMVASLADKLSNIEGAITTSASLQVLGGPFAQFADPMGLLHDSLNDMEGLQDRLTNLTNSLGRFNRQTGEIEIATFDKMRLKEAANAMGVDYGKLIEQATTAARRNEIEYQMRGLLNIPDEYKELLMNTATFQNGVAGAKDANGNFKSLSELTASDLKELADINKSQEDNIADIAGMLRGFLDVREGEEKQKATEAAKKYENESANIKDIYKTLGGAKSALDKLVTIELASKWVTPMFSQFGGGGFMRLRDKFLSTTLLAGTIGNFLAHGGIVRTHSDGGYISDGTPGKEMILNSAQHGEFVMNAQSTQMFLPMLMMMNRNPMGMMGMMRGGGMMPMMGMPYGGMMSTFGGGVVPGVAPGVAPGAQAQNMGYGFWGNRYYNKITKQFTAGAVQMKDSLIKTSHSLNTWDKGVNMSYRQQLDAAIEYKRLTQQEAYQSRKLMQYNNKALQERYTNMKMAKFNKGMAIAGNAATGVMMGGMVGFSQWNQYQADGTAIMDRGKALGGSIGAGVGGAVATGLLSAIPLVGPILGPTLGPMIGGAIGGAIGEWVGKIDKEDDLKERAVIRKRMENKDGQVLFDNLKGDYSKSELHSIEKALNDGVFKDSDVTPELLEKLQANGNDIILNNKIRKQSETKLVKHNNGGWTAVPTDGKEYVDNTLQGGEYVVKREYAEKSPGILGKINNGEVNDSNISSLLPLGPVVKVLESAVETIKQIPQNITMEPLNINISGKIQLDCGQGNTMDISNELMQNPTFINKLVDLVTKQMNINDNAGSFDKRGFFQRWSFL